MSTRATVHFDDRAIVYRHSDGYPDGLGQDLARFIRAARKLQDPRLNDASYLAAKWVVFDVTEYQKYMRDSNARMKAEGMKPYYPDPVDPLDFLGVGIVLEDPGDIEYRYNIDCDGSIEKIAYESREGDWDNPTWVHAGVIDTTGVDEE